MSVAGEPVKLRLIGSDGFTLLEMLVIIAILSLIAGVIFPSVDRAMRRQAFVEAATRFEGAVRAARAQAIRSGSVVWFALSADRHGFGSRGETDFLPENIVANLPDGPLGFFADGSATGGRIAIAEDRWSRRWYVRPSTGAIERIQ
ncbi:prepilin-type N-terminal cleavage/methylation domain-containing protein [Sphingomonas sp. QA11]|uniref:prepilin-type N-terminal cleavage/methylation domain-containing protein n=1 Tax=Sphingomonas sp. QA11 TaxID=2950605 RepID=UPI00234A1CC7|nr:prepilin-type N-terminal cleavage/methylation domain-containing protein [Sphingomonas sp. QA11]WCM28031.1 prepilin-type N-terminal cleavage/methylation domain-containing protein [Sphingomonas sp. QA11]